MFCIVCEALKVIQDYRFLEKQLVEKCWSKVHFKVMRIFVNTVPMKTMRQAVCTGMFLFVVYTN